MEKSAKVNIFLVIISAIAIFIVIFAFSRSISQTSPSKEYEDNIRLLNDTISALRRDIARYEREIERIDLERETIRKELELIIKDDEKVDTELANGDWDCNICYLTEFLSEEDSLGE